MTEHMFKFKFYVKRSNDLVLSGLFFLRSLFTAREQMETDYMSLKTEDTQLKLRHIDLQGKVGDAREQITILDVENTKITNRCEVLHQLNLSLEEDRKSLMSQV